MTTDRLSIVTMLPSAAVWPQFSMKGFNIIVTVSQKRLAFLATAKLFVNPLAIPVSPLLRLLA